jgi:hypothetical protein
MVRPRAGGVARGWEVEAQHLRLSARDRPSFKSLCNYWRKRPSRATGGQKKLAPGGHKGWIRR